jgi:hypothetical protein
MVGPVPGFQDSIIGSISELEDESMCWFSAEYANHVAEAKAGQRLGIKKMYEHSNWVVPESELEARWPTPVCLLDRTKVLFRFSESQAGSLHLDSEAEGVFRMLRQPKRDVFEFMDGSQIRLDDMSAGVIFDVLVVPGSEHLSAILTVEPALQDKEEREKAPFLARLLARL